MTIADAPPPPLQMLAQPITPSFCFKTLYNEQIILAPDDLIGGRERGGGGHREKNAVTTRRGVQ